MKRINEAIVSILKYTGATELADTIGVSPAMVSTWKNKDNDFTPRLAVARKIYENYHIQIWPYAKEALSEA